MNLASGKAGSRGCYGLVKHCLCVPFTKSVCDCAVILDGRLTIASKMVCNTSRFISSRFSTTKRKKENSLFPCLCIKAFHAFPDSTCSLLWLRGIYEKHDWQLCQLASYPNPLHSITHSWKVDLGPLNRFPLPLSTILRFVSRDAGRNIAGRRGYLFLFCWTSSDSSCSEQLFRHPALVPLLQCPAPAVQITSPAPASSMHSGQGHHGWLLSGGSLLGSFIMECFW